MAFHPFGDIQYNFEPNHSRLLVWEGQVAERIYYFRHRTSYTLRR